MCPDDPTVPPTEPLVSKARRDALKRQVVQDEITKKQAKLALLERKKEIQDGLPFLYGWKWYKWAHDFFESTNRINLLCAANQISKSSTQIRKCIDWATNQKKWPALWRQRPTQFWYLYPSASQARIEFDTKWKLFLPRGKFKDDPVYGWKEVTMNRQLFAIEFNSGVNVYFKTYSQDTQHLQTGTCDAIFCDEELPIEHYNELIFRLSASDGYFHMVFTATLGQEFWRLAMEPEEHEVETLQEAFKQTVSMYDCMLYEDGTPSPWTPEKIQMIESRCNTEAEILKRVMGRFIMDSTGKKYPQFDLKKNVRPAPGPVPEDWLVYSAVDYGSGGQIGHPAAIVFVAIRPDFRAGRVFLGWRGDGVETTAGDLVHLFVEMKTEKKLRPILQLYDQACKDLETIASRMGEAFLAADKSHEKGEQVINTLFKHNMLVIDQDPELQKLATELATLRKDTPKQKAKDNLTDALRYAVTRAPWDFSFIQDLPDALKMPVAAKTAIQIELEERRNRGKAQEKQEQQTLEEEFAEYNDLYSL